MLSSVNAWWRAWLRRLMVWQISSPWRVLAVVGVMMAASLALASKLKLITGFESLLPESRPSVIELHRVEAQTSSLSTIFVVLEGQDPAGLRRAADALVPALKALGPPWVGQVEDGVQDSINFIKPRAGLYADKKNLELLRDKVEARYAYEVSKASGLGIEDDEVPPAIDAEWVKNMLGVKPDDEQRYPGGHYQSADGKTVVIAIRCGVVGGDFARAEQALAKVGAVVAKVNPKSFRPERQVAVSVGTSPSASPSSSSSIAISPRSASSARCSSSASSSSTTCGFAPSSPWRWPSA